MVTTKLIGLTNLTARPLFSNCECNTHDRNNGSPGTLRATGLWYLLGFLPEVKDNVSVGLGSQGTGSPLDGSSLSVM